MTDMKVLISPRSKFFIHLSVLHQALL